LRDALQDELERRSPDKLYPQATPRCEISSWKGKNFTNVLRGFVYSHPTSQEMLSDDKMKHIFLSAMPKNEIKAWKVELKL
jgi:hypothetical protein